MTRYNFLQARGVILSNVRTNSTNLENMQNFLCFIAFYLTSCDANKVHVRRYFYQEYFATNQKSVRLRFTSFGSNRGFNVFRDLDLDLCYMLYKVDMKYWSFHAKFHKNPSCINRLYNMAEVKF